MESYNVYVMKSKKEQKCFISTHVKFDGMTIAGLRRDIPTWKRGETTMQELKKMSEAIDFTVEIDIAYHVDDLHRIADNMRALGYTVLNTRMTLKKSNKKV